MDYSSRWAFFIVLLLITQLKRRRINPPLPCVRWNHHNATFVSLFRFNRWNYICPTLNIKEVFAELPLHVDCVEHHLQIDRYAYCQTSFSLSLFALNTKNSILNFWSCSHKFCPDLVPAPKNAYQMSIPFNNGRNANTPNWFDTKCTY